MPKLLPVAVLEAKGYADCRRYSEFETFKGLYGGTAHVTLSLKTH